jgi:ribosomal protein S18 acetylase RimI-like enzyme
MTDLGTRAATEADLPFVYDLHRQAFRAYVEQSWGWDEGQQRDLFLAEYDPGLIEIVVFQGQDIGFIRLEDHGHFLFLNTIAFLPAYQGQGLGTTLVGRILHNAAERGLPVRLHVLRVNPARTLYAQLGFEVTGGDEYRLYMEAKPGSKPGPLNV